MSEPAIIQALLGATRERFLSHVERVDECWIWNGGCVRYGTFSAAGRAWAAHRASYELFVGPIPEDRQIHHICETPACVNPVHLVPLTPGENTRLSATSPAAVNARKTHCKRGHPLSGANLYVHPTRGIRQCRRCRREYPSAKARSRG